MTYSWDDSLNTGHKLVDDEHKAIVVLLNDLVAICNDNKPKAEILDSLNLIAKHTVEHFNDEEDIQKQINYPQYNFHKKQHDDFVAEVVEIIEEFKSNNDIPWLLTKVDEVIVAWLIRHMKGSDKHFVNYVLKQAQ